MGKWEIMGKNNSDKIIFPILLGNPVHVLPLYCFCMAYCQYIGQILRQCPKCTAFEFTIFLAYQGPQNCVSNFLLCFMFEIEMRNCGTNNDIGMGNLSKK